MDLTEKFLRPYLPEILEDIRALRRDVDEKLPHDSKILKQVQEWHKPYPIGFCAEIRNGMLTRIHREVQNPFNTRPGIQKLAEFVEAGGIIKPIWGIDSGKYFQNAIQIGDVIVDVANDTVNPAKVPVVLYESMETSQIQPINSFEEFADITEKYWQQDVYPNIYLPQLAPVYPMLSVVVAHKGDEYVDGLILVKVPDDLHEKNTQQTFKLSHDFIFSSPYNEKRLPEELLMQLAANPKLSEVSSNPEVVRDEFEGFKVDCIEDAAWIRDLGKPLCGIILAKVKRGTI